MIGLLKQICVQSFMAPFVIKLQVSGKLLISSIQNVTSAILGMSSKISIPV